MSGTTVFASSEFGTTVFASPVLGKRRGIGIPRFRRAGTNHFSLGNWLLAGKHPEQLLQQNDEQMHRVVPTLSMLAGLFLR